MPGGRIVLTDAGDGDSRAPAVHAQRVIEAYEAGARAGIVEDLVNHYWSYPKTRAYPNGNAQLDPYNTAKVILGGKAAFRRRCVPDLRERYRANEHIQGDVDPTSDYRQIWFRLNIRLKLWCAGMCKRPWWGPADVVRLFESKYRGRDPLKPMAKEKWIIEEQGANSSTAKAWKSSGLRREGTFDEILSDLDLTPSELNRERAIWREQCEAGDENQKRHA